MKISRRNMLLSSSATPMFFTQNIGVQKKKFNTTEDKIIIIHADGGLDGLHLVSPTNNYYYRKYRPNIKKIFESKRSQLPLNYSLGNEEFFLNPDAFEFYKLFKENTLSFVHATGLRNNYKKHYEAIKFYRKCLLDLSINGYNFIASHNLKQELEMIAENIITNKKTKPITLINYNGWDHHNNLPSEFSVKINELSNIVSMFWKKVIKIQEKVTVIITTEFGRKLSENYSLGTDHGIGSVMIILSHKINGGKIYGSWPGLGPNQLINGSLNATTDSKVVLNEIIQKIYSKNYITEKDLISFSV